MKTISRQQFEFQTLSDGTLTCIFRPKSTFAKKKTYLVVAQPATRIYELMKVCEPPNPMWYNLNYLAHICEKYDNQIIPTI